MTADGRGGAALGRTIAATVLADGVRSGTRPTTLCQKRWLVFGTYDVYSHPRVAVLIEGLRAAGETLDEVNVPLRLNTAGRVAMLRQPWRLPLLAFKLVRCWLLLAMRVRRQARIARPDVVLVGYLGHFDVWLARLLFRHTPIVLDHLVSAAGTARDRGLDGDGGIKAKLLLAIDDGALRCGDIIVVDTPEHQAALPEPIRRRSVVVPVGATANWFALGHKVLKSVSSTEDRPLRAVFVGVFTPLHGTVTLGKALAALADDDSVEVTVVGTGQDYGACKHIAAANPRVTWVDWVPGDDLPAFVADHDVSLGIFGTTAKAREVVPTKVYQGAAAGCAIITSDTPPQRAAMGDAAVFVPAGDADALAAALRRLAGDRAELARLRIAAATRAAERYTPAAAVEPMRTATEDLVVRSTARVPNPPLTPRAALRWSVTRRIVEQMQPKTILELGCGMGGFGVRLAKLADYTAAEPDDSSFEIARQRITPVGGTVIHGDHTKVPEGNQFDLVCAFEVLEHIADDAAALAGWLPLVRPGGHLMVSVPADPQRFGPSDIVAGHYRRYTSDSLRARFVEAGCVDVELTHYGWPLAYLLDVVRNRLMKGQVELAEDTLEERSAGSGRLLQPRTQAIGALIQAGIAPFALLQRTQTDKGPALVAVATRPAK